MYRFYINSHRWRPTSSQWIYANQCLPTDELKRIDQYVYQRDVKFTLIGQLLIRYLLTRVFHEESSSFIIQRTKLHRPFVQSQPSFDFNLSHHHELVCIGGTFNGQIGCDTMLYRTDKIRKENSNLFQKKFTLQEYDAIKNNRNDFYRLWCLKESYVKWLGMGIGFPLLRLNFHLQTKDFHSKKIISDTTLEIDDQLNNQNLRFDEQMIFLSDHEQQIITLCLATNHQHQAFVELTIDDILHGCTPFDKNKEDDLISWERFQMKKQTDLI